MSNQLLSLKSGLRTVSLEILRRLPISSETLGPPKGFHLASEHWLAARTKAASGSRIQPIFPPFSGGSRRRPTSLHGGLPWQFEAYYGGLSADDPAAWVLEIPGGRVVGEGAVITPDDRLLCDVSREQINGGDQAKHSALQHRRFAPMRRLRGRVAVVAVAGAGNYWHWFFDVLPRFLLLQKCHGGLDAIDTFIVNRLSKPFQRETLLKLGIPAGKILECHRNDFHIKAEVLVVPSLFVETPARWASRTLREQLVYPSSGESRPKRLYVSRSDAGIRRVLNEEDLMEKLTARGFHKVTLSGRTLAEQCDLFSSAEIIVAPHGAGLTNLIFSQEGKTIVEIFPPTYINPCYWVLSDHLGLSYYFSVGEGELPPPPPPGVNHDLWFWSFVQADAANRQNIRVNIPGVVEVVDRALASCG